MARSAIKLTRDQREAIYQAVRTHLVGLRGRESVIGGANLTSRKTLCCPSRGR